MARGGQKTGGGAPLVHTREKKSEIRKGEKLTVRDIQRWKKSKGTRLRGVGTQGGRRRGGGVAMEKERA